MSEYLPANPYAGDGMQYAAQASEHNAWGYEDRLIMASMANSFATLALAYEQRTANLIAAFGNMMEDDTDTFLGERLDGYELAKAIQSRLGL